MLYKVTWGFEEFESYSEVFRNLREVREMLAEENQLNPFQIAEVTTKGVLIQSGIWIRVEQVPEPPFHAEAEQRVREITLWWSAIFFLVLAGIGAVAIVGAILQAKWSVHP